MAFTDHCDIYGALNELTETVVLLALLVGQGRWS